MPNSAAYLDTCIVSGLAKKDLAPADASALLRILEAWNNGAINLVTSGVTKEEINRIPAEYREPHAAIYSLLLNVPSAPTHVTRSRLFDGSVLSAVLHEDPLFNQLRNLLPDAGDAEHVFQAAKSKVDYLITVDRQSFLRHAVAVEQLCGVRLAKPVAFEEAVLAKG
jgi:hypothetical protein